MAVPVTLALAGLLAVPAARAEDEPGIPSPVKGEKVPAGGGVGIVPPRPDLRITKLEVIPDKGSSLVAGQKLWLKATWERTGGVPTAVFRMNFFMDGAPTTPGCGAGCGSTLNDDNLARAGGALARPWTGVAGVHTVEAYIDSASAVTESNERNNKARLTFKVLPAPLVVEKPARIAPKSK